ncbi:MAG: GGDEF domain-containing protein [Betaproteobacteria bacterium]
MARIPQQFAGTPLGNAFEQLSERRVTQARETAVTAHDLALACDDEEVAAWAALALAQADYQDAAFASSIRRALDVQVRAEALDDARLAVEAALALGSGFWRIGDTETALSVIEKEIDRAFRLGDRELLAAVHRVLGVSLSEIGGHVAGVATLERAFGYALESGAPRAICECANSLGSAIFASCRSADAETKADALSNAEAMIRTSLEVATEENDLPAIAAAESSLGAVIIERGDWVEGRLWAARALDKTRVSGDLLSEGYALVSLAVCDRELGALGAALSSLEQAYAIAAAQAAKPLMRVVHLQVSQSLERADRFADALAHYKRYHALEREIAADIAEQRARMSTLRLDGERARREADQFRAETKVLSDAVERDALTGIGNRRAFDRALSALLARGGGRCTLALIDCDHFKQVNDRASHVAGDRVLQRIASVLKQASRRTDLAARFGGDEFAIVFAEATLDEAKSVCERIRGVVERHPGDDTPAVTISIGLAEASGGDSVETLLQRADAALYRAKAAGRNQVVADA